MLWQAGVRNVCAPLPNLGEADREPGPALGVAILLVPLTFGLTRLDEEPFRDRGPRDLREGAWGCRPSQGTPLVVGHAEPGPGPLAVPALNQHQRD